MSEENEEGDVKADLINFLIFPFLLLTHRIVTTCSVVYDIFPNLTKESLISE